MTSSAWNSAKHLELSLICPARMERLERLSADTPFNGILRCYGVKESSGRMQRETEGSLCEGREDKLQLINHAVEEAPPSLALECPSLFKH